MRVYFRNEKYILRQCGEAQLFDLLQTQSTKKFDCCHRSFQKANCFNLYLLVYAV